MNNDIKDIIKETVSLRDLVGQYTDLRQVNNRTWEGLCPVHDDHHPSFNVFVGRDGTEAWCCHACHRGKKDVDNGNYGTDCFAFVQWIEKNLHGRDCSFWRAMLICAEFAGIDIPTYEKKAPPALLAEAYHANLTPEATRYLTSRGITKQSSDFWKLGYYPFREHGEVVDRITIPLYDLYGNVTGFTKRALTNRGDKYRHSYKAETSQILFGSQALTSSQKEVYIVEGPMDVIMATQAGIKNVVATLGCSLSRTHAQYLLSKKLKPIIAYDSDRAGIEGREKAMLTFAEFGVIAQYVTLPVGMDLAEAVQAGEDIKSILAKPVNVSWLKQLHALLEDQDRYRAGVAVELSQIRNHIYLSTERKQFDNITRNLFGVMLCKR